LRKYEFFFRIRTAIVVLYVYAVGRLRLNIRHRLLQNLGVRVQILFFKRRAYPWNTIIRELFARSIGHDASEMLRAIRYVNVFPPSPSGHVSRNYIMFAFARRAFVIVKKKTKNKIARVYAVARVRSSEVFESVFFYKLDIFL